MPTIKRSDLVAGLLLCLLAVYVYHEGAAMPAAKRGLGPGGYPKFVAVGLMLLGAILAIQSFIKKIPPAGSMTAARALRVLFFAPLCLAYAWALRPFGFVAASFAFLVAASYFFGYRRHGVIALFGAGLTLTVYVIFRHVFLVLLPTGTIF